MTNGFLYNYNMYKFGNKSMTQLVTCHEDIYNICHKVIGYIDFSVMEGSRTTERQTQLFQAGASKLDGITQRSKHQVIGNGLSLAVDIAPYPVDWGDARRFFHLAGYIFMASDWLYHEGVITHKLRWGGDWDNDGNFKDQSFNDYPHFELIDKDSKYWRD